MNTLSDYIQHNDFSSSFNERIHQEFTQLAEQNDALLAHRKYIEDRKLGFGDRAFHHMWYLLLKELKGKSVPNILEIGVYKGQVVSLWYLISKIIKRDFNVFGVSPFEGNEIISNTILAWLKKFIDPIYRKDKKLGNLYEKTDYLLVIKNLFEHFDLPFENLTKIKGLSESKVVLNTLEDKAFDLVYIDGDHSLKGCKRDIHNFGPKISPGGYLVIDDASCNIPGGESGAYWKGYQAVSDACEIIPSLGFTNVLNIGHNRIYRRNE